MKSKLLSEGCPSSTTRYQIGKCYLWTTNGRSLVILCSYNKDNLQGTIIYIFAQSFKGKYIIGYNSTGWGNEATPWTGKIELETD